MKPKRYEHIPERSMNKILAAVSFLRWDETLEPVKLSAGTVLYAPDEAIEHVYFLTNALVSIVSLNSEGGVEIGWIGYEGMVGVPVIRGGVMPYQAVVQMGGDAFGIRGRRL